VKRIHALDGLRGVLSLLVVACHADGLFGVDHFVGLAVASVAIFFVLSGHVLTRGYDGRYAAFLVRRVIRLWPTYAAGMIAGCLLLWRMPDWSQLFWWNWVPHFPADMMAVPDPPEWSMSIEAAAMIFMPAIEWFGGNGWRAILILPAWVGLARLDWHFNWCGFFLIGAALSRYTLRSEVLESRLAQWLGKVSYSLYVSHWIVVRGCAMAFGHWGALAGLPVKSRPTTTPRQHGADV